MSDDLATAPVAIVTGAASGLGRTLADRLAREGFRLGLVDVDPEVTLRARGCDMALTIDVAAIGAAQMFVATALQRFGRIDVLVNNAALVTDNDLDDVSADVWRRIVETNLTAPFLWCKAVLAPMKAARYGRIVNISSHAALRGTVGRTAYGASKAGLDGLTRTLSTELAPFGVTVNSVAPGAIETDRTRQTHSESRRHAWENAIPMGRYGEAEEFASVVSFFASKESCYVTGQTIAVDGGFTTAGLRPF